MRLRDLALRSHVGLAVTVLFVATSVSPARSEPPDAVRPASAPVVDSGDGFGDKIDPSAASNPHTGQVTDGP